MLTLRFKNTLVVFEFSFFAVLCLMLILSEKRTVLACLVSSFLHELGHIAVTIFCGGEISKLVFGGFGIRLEKNENVFLSYKREAAIAAGGVAVNLFLFFVFLPLWFKTKRESLAIFAFVNFFIAALNLIPVGILDSGNFLRYILLARFDGSTVLKITGVLSNAFTLALCAACVVYTVARSVNPSFITVCVYLLFANLQTINTERKRPKAAKEKW